MNDKQITKLFNYIQSIDNRLTKIEDNMSTKNDVDNLVNVIDGYAGKI